MQTVSQFLNQPLPTIVPVNETIAPLSPRMVAGSPYPQSMTEQLPMWSRLVSSPISSLFSRSRNEQT